MKRALIFFLLSALTAASIGADYTETKYNEARGLAKKGNYASAERMLISLVNENPAYAEFRYALGDIYLKQGKLDEAEALYLGITIINPNSDDAYFALSGLYEKSGRLTDAAKAMEKAVRIKPESQDYNSRLSLLYESLGDTKRAEFYKKGGKRASAVDAAIAVRIAVWLVMAGVFVFFMLRNVSMAALFCVVSSVIMFMGKRNIEALVFVFLGSVAMFFMWLKTKPAKNTGKEKQKSSAPPTIKEYDEAVKKAYLILGLKNDATKSEIKSAYHKLAKKHHPDRTGGDKKGEEIIKAVNSAYELLRRRKKV